MIVKMREITLLVAQKHVDSALKTLRGLGLLHIKHLRKPLSDTLNVLENEMAVLDRAIAALAALERPQKDLSRDKFYSRAKEVVALEGRKRELEVKLSALEKTLLWFKEWGDFSWASLEELHKSGIFIRLYQCPLRALKQLKGDRLVFVLGSKGGVARIALASRSKEESLNLPEVAFPAAGSPIYAKQISDLKGDLENIEQRLSELSAYKECFRQQRTNLLKELDFYRVKSGMLPGKDIGVLKGFSPVESVAAVAAAARKEGWATIIQEPENREDVPTLIRNPHWVRIIQPVFKIMGVLPGYKEYDISRWFLIFFSLFFAMLIGDAGYGLILLAAALFIGKKFNRVPRDPLILMYILSAGAVVWGAITGTWFGFEKIAQLPFFSSLVIERINSFVDANQTFMIYLCFVIGAVHLTVAHGLIAFRFLNSWFALAQAGWICIIWSAFFIAGKFALNRPIPEVGFVLGILGVILVVFFSSPQKNILKGAAVSLANLPLKAISSFSDIISYLRLFAVGYATVAVAETFNGMALNIGFNSVISGLAAAVILFLGHALNVMLGLLAVVVHGVRLNLLEFSGHLDMEWSGVEYNPFRE